MMGVAKNSADILCAVPEHNSMLVHLMSDIHLLANVSEVKIELPPPTPPPPVLSVGLHIPEWSYEKSLME